MLKPLYEHLIAQPLTLRQWLLLKAIRNHLSSNFLGKVSNIKDNTLTF
jgi:hypothetical protein